MRRALVCCTLMLVASLGALISAVLHCWLTSQPLFDPLRWGITLLVGVILTGPFAFLMSRRI